MCLVLIVGVGSWWFGPTVGKPVLAEIQGPGLSLERAGQQLSAREDMPLQSGDVLRTTENGKAAISFTPERTRLALGPGTELEVLGPSRGKRLRLGSGKLEASVARQRPFRPLVITTPQAEARVVGTEFSLLAAEDATRLEVTEGQVRLTRLGDAASVEVTAGHYAVAGARDVLTPLPLTGSLFREYWTNIPGNSWTYLITQTNYPKPAGWMGNRGRTLPCSRCRPTGPTITASGCVVTCIPHKLARIRSGLPQGMMPRCG